MRSPSTHRDPDLDAMTVRTAALYARHDTAPASPMGDRPSSDQARPPTRMGVRRRTRCRTKSAHHVVDDRTWRTCSRAFDRQGLAPITGP